MSIFNLTSRTCLRVISKTLTFSKMINISKPLCCKKKNILIIGLIPIFPSISAKDTSVEEEKKITDIKKEEGETPTIISDNERTPWERVKAVYEVDEFGNFSKELTTTLHCVYVSVIVGMVVGGIQRSRFAFTDFMERNQATLFDNHLDAKKRLQNHVTIHFGKGALHWAWRVSAFTGGFVLTFFTLHAYRGTTSIIDYGISGGVIGALMRIKLGPPGIIIGGALGCILGLVGGAANQTLLSIYGASYDDILAHQYEWERERKQLMEVSAARDVEKSGVVPKTVIEAMKNKPNKIEDI